MRAAVTPRSESIHVAPITGSMRDGPWSYRVLSVVLVSPIYASFLVTFGTLAGRHIFFASMARKRTEVPHCLDIHSAQDTSNANLSIFDTT